LNLCKLNSSADIPDQNCFDQNPLKMTIISPLTTSGKDNVSVVVDDYTLRLWNFDKSVVYNVR
jgi:hypothetical protein